MRIAVFGTGGVGAYFGGRLAQTGEDVVFIARGAHLEAIQQSGLRVESPQGNFEISPAQAAQNPARVGQVDLVLVGVKAWQVPDAAQEMQPLLGPETFVVPLQNGVDAPQQLSAVLGKGHVLGGLCKISALVAAPGLIRHIGIEPYIAFGEFDGAQSERALRLKAAFDRAGVTAEIPQDIQAAMWQKFVFIAAIGGVGALARAPLGVLRSVPETRQLLEQAMQEIERVAQARRVSLPGDIVAKTLAGIDAMPAGVVASMARDIAEGRPSELGSQNGAVVRMGLESGVPTPLHAAIYHSLLPLELRARGELTF